MSDELRCPSCDSVNVIFSKKRQRHVCEDCDYELLSVTKGSSIRVFLSYGHDSNEELVRRIKSDLEQRWHDVWFDKNEIKFGDDWRASITEGITGCHKFVAFLSKHSTREPGVCLDEIGTRMVPTRATSRPSLSRANWKCSHRQALAIHSGSICTIGRTFNRRLRRKQFFDLASGYLKPELLILNDMGMKLRIS